VTHATLIATRHARGPKTRALALASPPALRPAQEEPQGGTLDRPLFSAEPLGLPGLRSCGTRVRQPSAG